MKKKFALLVAAAMLSTTVLSGCGGGGGTETTAAFGGGDAQAVDTASGGNNLVVEIGPDPETIDPALNSAIDGANMIIHLFEPLLNFDKDNNIIGGMAETWEVSDDGLTYTFHLRDGLKWSDGTPLTANDFVYTFKRVADPLTAAPYGYDLLCMVKGYDEASNGNVDALGVSAPDDQTFGVELSYPCVYFDKICAFATMSPVQQATIDANGEAWAVDPSTYVCNGPMKIKEWVPGSHILMEKNENYWNADAVTADTIKFVLMEDVNAAYSAYNSGEVMMIKDVPTEEVPNLRDNPEFNVDPILGTYYISLNLNREYLQDVRVRQALSLALDRAYIADTIMQGTYSAAKNFVGPGVSDVEPGSSFADVTLEQYGEFFHTDDFEGDLAKAKELMAEAGYPNGEGFPAIEYMTNDVGYHKPLAEYLQSAWGELGINMDIKIVEWASFTPTRRNGDYDIARNGWVYDYDDPSNMLNLFETENGNNDGKYSNPEYDALIDQARTTADKTEHYALLHEAEQMLLNDMAMIPIAYQNDFWLQKPELQGTWHSPYGYWYFMYGYIGDGTEAPADGEAAAAAETEAAAE